MSEALFTLYESTGGCRWDDHLMDLTDVSEGWDTKLSEASERKDVELSSLLESEIGLKRSASPVAVLGVLGKVGGLEPRELWLCSVMEREGLVCMDCERLAPVSKPLSKLALSMVCDTDDTGELWASMPMSDLDADTQFRYTISGR